MKTRFLLDFVYGLKYPGTTQISWEKRKLAIKLEDQKDIVQIRRVISAVEGSVYCSAEDTDAASLKAAGDSRLIDVYETPIDVMNNLDIQLEKIIEMRLNKELLTNSEVVLIGDFS